MAPSSLRGTPWTPSEKLDHTNQVPDDDPGASFLTEKTTVVIPPETLTELSVTVSGTLSSEVWRPAITGSSELTYTGSLEPAAACVEARASFTSGDVVACAAPESPLPPLPLRPGSWHPARLAARPTALTAARARPGILIKTSTGCARLFSAARISMSSCFFAMSA